MSPLERINNNPQTFAHNGVVVPSYRTRGNKRYGPYYRVAYRVAGRQCSIYLGRCKNLANQARELLTKLQYRRDFFRLSRRGERQRRATLRRVIRQWQQTIRAYGLDYRGCEVRGWRRLGIPRIDKTTPFNAAQRAAAAILLGPPPNWATHPHTPDPRYWQNGTPVDQQQPKDSSHHAPP